MSNQNFLNYRYRYVVLSLTVTQYITMQHKSQ